MLRHYGLFGQTVLIFVILLFSVSGCSLFSQGPDVAWSENQQSPIVQITDCCGFVPQLVPLNYIPDAQIWGDGRIIWINELPEGGREVLKSELSQSQIESFLERLVQTGFFQWRDEYADYSVTDLPWQCLNVELIRTSKSVCEYYRGAPQAFHDLYADLADGLGQSGSPYRPERAWLTSFHMEGIGISSTPLDQWNDSETGLDLSEAEEGIWVEGMALERAWSIINENQFSNMVESDGEVYQIALQIPGISMLGPEEERSN